MPTYTFFRYSAARESPSFEVEDFEARDMAVAHGQELLDHNERYSAIEVIEDDTEVAVLHRDGPQQPCQTKSTSS